MVSGNGLEPPVILNDKVYVMVEIRLQNPTRRAHNLLEIDPAVTEAVIINSDTITDTDFFTSNSIATDGRHLYFTHLQPEGTSPAVYDPTNNTVTNLAGPETSTWFHYRRIGDRIAVRYSRPGAQTFLLTPEGLGLEMQTAIESRKFIDLGDRFLSVGNALPSLYAIEYETGDSIRVAYSRTGRQKVLHVTPISDSEAIYLREEETSDMWAIWKTDGTRAGTRKVGIMPITYNSAPSSVAVFGSYAGIRGNRGELFLFDLEEESIERANTVITDMPTPLIGISNRLYFYADHPVFGVEPHFVSYTTQDSISGVVFDDTNGNGIQEVEEQGIGGYLVEISGGALAKVYTEADGSFVVSAVENDTYTFRVDSENCYTATSDNSFTFTYSSDSTYYLKFALQPHDGPANLRTLLNSGTIRCGFAQDLWLTVLNDGCEPLAGKTTITFPLEMSFLEADIAPLVMEDNLLTFAFDTLQPGESQRFRTRFRMPDETFAGQAINLGAAAGAISVEGAMIEADTFTYHEVLRCAIDPNDKQVTPSREEPSNSNFTQINEVLRYTIRFQNTGNDTAFMIRIEDPISESLNLETFKPLASSHLFNTSVRNDRTAVFLFKKILLPDSTTNFPDFIFAPWIIQ